MNKLTINEVSQKKYDAIIVGAGLAGATHAERLSANGATVLLIEKRNHVAGNCYTEKVHGIDVHKFGSHILHTNNDSVWSYLNRFTSFNDYKHRVIADTGSEHVMLPFSMVTFMQLFNVHTVQEVKTRIESETWSYFGGSIPGHLNNFEEQAIAIVGTTVYEKLIRKYTEKQWGRSAEQLPAEIIKRLPIRWNTDTTYFNNAKYQGIPVSGYTHMIENMLSSVHIDLLHVDFLQNLPLLGLLNAGGSFIFTGQIDELFNYQLGALEYRSLEFVENILDQENYQGTAVVNYTDDREFTRTTEHKHYSTDASILASDTTIITSEKAVDHIPGKTMPYYPINDDKNNALHQKYVDMFNSTFSNGYLSGRLALYKYFDMDVTVNQALISAQNILDKVLIAELNS